MIAWLLRPISVWIRRLYSESDPISRSNCCGQSFSMYCRHSYIFYLQKKGRVQNYFTIWAFSSISLLGIVIDNLAFRLFVQTNPFERLIWRVKIHVKLLKNLKWKLQISSDYFFAIHDKCVSNHANKLNIQNQWTLLKGINFTAWQHDSHLNLWVS